MSFPDFFRDVPSLTLKDPLAQMLGAAEDGVMTYTYADAVKLAGHSCPTVAGAWLMLWRGLNALYGDDLPLRGGIRVEFQAARDAGTTGVVANVMGLVTGAAGEEGFKGLNGQQARCGLLRFGVDMPAEVRLSRVDTGASVLLDYRPQVVPPDPGLPPLMARLVGGTAEPAERAEFARVWRDRVRRILLEHALDEALISVRPG